VLIRRLSSSYLNLAELRLLQQDQQGAFGFWKECLDSYVALLLPACYSSTIS
jgi:hypothetical protein